jgi:hypothetical protein
MGQERVDPFLFSNGRKAASVEKLLQRMVSQPEYLYIAIMRAVVRFCR